MADTARRQIPAVNTLAQHVETDLPDVPRPLIIEASRIELDAYRESLRDESTRPVSTKILADRVATRLRRDMTPPLAPVINGTGVIIHTGLGRAPMALSAVKAMWHAAGYYAPVELDLATGKRGHRSRVVRDLLCRLTGAESATVVNNNAAALVLVLNTLATGREVVVSRGELIEIGGSFRLPDIMTAAGAVLREVGTTNRTRLHDYEQAIGDDTAAVFKVHPSNYRVEGFQQEVPIDELAALAHAHGLPVVHDTGSGALRPLGHLGFGADEPDARTSIEAGADLVLFSGDKLLGGPQAGIIVGRAELVEKLERHPLMRALRVDKVTLAGLGATLQLHRDERWSREQLLVFQLILLPNEKLQERGRRIVEHLATVDGIEARLEPCVAYIGGGSLPTETVDSTALVVTASAVGDEELLARLRGGTPPVVGRVHDGAVWLDLRTVFTDQDDKLVAAIATAVGTIS